MIINFKCTVCGQTENVCVTPTKLEIHRGYISRICETCGHCQSIELEKYEQIEDSLEPMNKLLKDILDIPNRNSITINIRITLEKDQ